MSKEEKIQEAYGEYFNKDINDNGWCNNHSLRIRVDALEIDRSRFGWRPKSLQGIENNNGWIKIESEYQYDLLENGEYEWYNINNDKYDKGDLWSYGIFTHYKIVPITKPQPPIY